MADASDKPRVEMGDPVPGESWGFMLGDHFIQIAKTPILLLADPAFRQPPFDIVMPDESVRHIISRPTRG